jgi:hypothetical protein
MKKGSGKGGRFSIELPPEVVDVSVGSLASLSGIDVRQNEDHSIIISTWVTGPGDGGKDDYIRRRRVGLLVKVTGSGPGERIIWGTAALYVYSPETGESIVASPSERDSLLPPLILKLRSLINSSPPPDRDQEWGITEMVQRTRLSHGAAGLARMIREASEVLVASISEAATHPGSGVAAPSKIHEQK